MNELMVLLLPVPIWLGIAASGVHSARRARVTYYDGYEGWQPPTPAQIHSFVATRKRQ